MLEAIKGYVGVMLLCATFLVFGSIVGLVSRPNDNGIYLSLSWDGKEVFVLGKNVMSASSLDLNNLSATDAKILAVKLERLSPNDMLGTRSEERRVGKG